MAWPFQFANVSTLSTLALDANFNAVGALTPVPCTVAGTDSLTLTPLASTPTVASYSNYMQFTGIAVNTNTSSVSAIVGTAGLLPVYKDTSGSPAVLTGGEIVASCAFGLLYDSALNSSNGGFHLITYAAGGGSPSTDYFDTFEELTSGASPVDIDPTIFHTRVTTGGTAGTEVVRFANYTPSQAGKPHLVTMVTKTNPSDVVSITGQSPILATAFGPLADQGDNAVVNPTAMHLTAVDQGFVLTWADFSWEVTELVQEPIITFHNAGNDIWGYDAPSVMVQNTDNTFGLKSDPSNTQFELGITANAILGSATLCPAAVYSVGITSTGAGAVGYVDLEGPFPGVPSGGAYHLIYFKVRANAADTISFAAAITNNNIRNADGSAFTSIIMTTQNQSLTLQHHAETDRWRIVYATPGICVPEWQQPILGSQPPYNIARNGGSSYTVTTSENFRCFSANGGGNVTFNAPAASQTGNEYTFMNSNNVNGSTDTIIVQMPASTACTGAGGVATSAAGTLQSTEKSASITIRDIAAPAYQIVAITGTWTTT